MPNKPAIKPQITVKTSIMPGKGTPVQRAQWAKLWARLLQGVQHDS